MRANPINRVMSQVDVSLDTVRHVTTHEIGAKPLSDTSERHMLLGRHVRWTCRIARPTDTSDAPPTSAEPAYATRRTARHVVLDVSTRHVRRAASLVGCDTLDTSPESGRSRVGRSVARPDPKFASPRCARRVGRS